jgi:NAD-dependent SIR2 family protein deacetylase
MSGKGLPFYRCVLCGTVVSNWDIYYEPHSCPKCGGARVKPTNLGWWETIVQIWKHPKVWTWDESFFR